MLLKNTLTEVSKKFANRRERFAPGIIRHDIYEGFSEKFRAEKSRGGETEQAGNKLSNLETFVEYAIKMCSNLSY